MVFQRQWVLLYSNPCCWLLPSNRRSLRLTVLQEINRRFAVTVLPGLWLGDNPIPVSCRGPAQDICPESFLCESGRRDTLASNGMLLGVDADSDWNQQTITLGSGDRILLFSDGATETRSPNGDLFGTERLTRGFPSAVNSRHGPP